MTIKDILTRFWSRSSNTDIRLLKNVIEDFENTPNQWVIEEEKFFDKWLNLSDGLNKINSPILKLSTEIHGEDLFNAPVYGIIIKPICAGNEDDYIDIDFKVILEVNGNSRDYCYISFSDVKELVNNDKIFDEFRTKLQLFWLNLKKDLVSYRRKDVIEESLEEFVNKYTPTLTNCWEFSKELVDNWNKENEIDGDRRLKLTSPESVKELESVFLKYFPKEIVDIEMRIKPDTEIFPVCACLESLILLRDIRNPDKQTIIRNYNDRNQPVIYLEKGDGQLNGEIFYGNNTDLYTDEFLPDLKDEKYILNVHNDDYEIDVFGCEVDVPTLVNVFKISKEKISELFRETIKAKSNNKDIIEESIETNTPLDKALNELLLKAYDFDKKELKKLGIEEAIKQLKTAKWTAKKSTFDAYQYKQLETNININDYNFTFYIRETEPWGDEKTISDLRFNIGFRYYNYVVSTEIELKSIMQLNISQNEMKSFISDCAKYLKVQQKKYVENIALKQRMGWEVDNNVIEESVESFDVNKRYEEIVNPEGLTEEKIRELENTDEDDESENTFDDVNNYWWELENNIPERKRLIDEIRNGEAKVSVLDQIIYVDFKDKEQMQIVPSDFESSYGTWSIGCFRYMYNVFNERYSTKDLMYVFGIKPEIVYKALSNIKRVIRTNDRLEVVEESVMNEEYYKKVSNLDIINKLYRHSCQSVAREIYREDSYQKLKEKFTEYFKNAMTDGKWYVDYRSFNHRGLPKPYLRHNFGGYPEYRLTIECSDLRMPISEYVIQFSDRYELLSSGEIKANEIARLNISEETLREFYTNLYKYLEETEKIIRDAERTNYGKGEVIEESEEFPMNRDNEIILNYLRNNCYRFEDSDELFKTSAYDIIELIRNSDDMYVGIVDADTGIPCDEKDSWAWAAIVINFKYRNKNRKAIFSYSTDYQQFSFTINPSIIGFIGMGNINATMLEKIYNIPSEFIKDCIKLAYNSERYKYYKDYDRKHKKINIEEAEELPSMEDIAKEVEEWDETKEEEALLNKVGELLPTMQYRIGHWDVAEKCRAILTMLEIPVKWELITRNGGDAYLVYPISGSLLVDFELTFDAGAIDAVKTESYIPYTLSLLDMRGYRTNLMQFTFSEILSQLHIPLELARKLHDCNIKYSAMFRKYMKNRDNKDVIEESVEDNKKYVDYVLNHNVVLDDHWGFEEPGQKEAEINKIAKIISCFARASKKEMGWFTTDGEEIREYTSSDEKVYLLKIYSSEDTEYTFNVYYSAVRNKFLSNLGKQDFAYYEMSAGDLKRLVDITDEEIYKLIEEGKKSPQTKFFKGLRQSREEDKRENGVIEESIDSNILLKRYSEITNPEQVSASQLHPEIDDDEYYDLMAEFDNVRAREKQVEEIENGQKNITTSGKRLFRHKPCIQVEFNNGNLDIGNYAYFNFNGYNWDLDVDDCVNGNFYDSFTTQDLIQIFKIPEDLIKEYLEYYKSLNIPFPLNKNNKDVIEESVDIHNNMLQLLKDNLKIGKNVKIKEKHIELFSALCKKYFTNEKVIDYVVNFASHKIGDTVNIQYFINLIEYIETLTSIANHKREKLVKDGEYGDIYIELGDVGAKVYRSSSRTDELFIRAGLCGINPSIKTAVEVFNIKPNNISKLIKLTPEYNVPYSKRKQQEADKDVIEEALEVTNVSLYRKIRKLMKDKEVSKENFDLMKETILANTDFDPKIVNWVIDYVWNRTSRHIMNFNGANIIDKFDIEYAIQLIEIITIIANHTEEKIKNGHVFIDDIQLSSNSSWGGINGSDEQRIWLYYYPYHLSTSLPTNCITLFNLKPESLQELFRNKDLYKRIKPKDIVEE